MRKLPALFIIFFLCSANVLSARENRPGFDRLAPEDVALLSLIPGEGQFYNQKPAKGWFFFGLEVSLMSSIAVSIAESDKDLQAYRLSGYYEEKQTNLYRYRNQKLITRNLTYFLVLVKALSALDAYVDANFFELDYQPPQSLLKRDTGKIYFSASFDW